MSHKKRTLVVFGSLVGLLWSVACGSATPTVDVNSIRTEVAATVLAQVTQALALTPSITPIPSSTSTNRPTSTPIPTDSPAPSAAATQATSGTTTVVTKDLAQWAAQSIADDTIFTPGQTFTLVWTLKNSGTSTWTAGYMLRYFGGETFGAPKEVLIGRDVPPGDQVDITLEMKAPASPGSYLSDWVMSSNNRSNFKEPVYLKIKVAVPATSTRTPTSTPTPKK